jgi:hypothetical protein
MRAIVLCSLMACSSSAASSPVDTSPVDAAAEATDAAESDAACKLSKPYSSKDAACNGCVERSCCVVVNRCLDDKRCDDDYVNCILACALAPDDAGGDAAAEAKACIDTYPEGKKLYDQATGCAEARCGC